jgi:hypothetical protein
MAVSHAAGRGGLAGIGTRIVPWRQLAIGIVNVSDRLTAPPARARHGGRGGHCGPCPPGPVTKARRVTAVTAGAVITAVTARGMRVPTITAVTAVTVRSCPPCRAVTTSTACRSLVSRVSRRPSGWAIPSAGSPAEAGQRRTTISYRAGGRAKSRSNERVAVTSTGGDAAMKSLASSEKERSESCNG